MNKLAPKYGRTTGPSSLSIAGVTNAGGFRMDGRFRKCDDLGSFRWVMVDDFNHNYLKYPTDKNFTNVTLAFRYESSASHKPLDSNQAPSMTIQDSAGNHEVRLLNYATRVSGANTQASGTVSVAVTGSALGAITGVAVNAGGSGYVVGDILTVSGGNGLGKVNVDAVDGSGAVTAISINAAGADYAVANGVATTGGTGSGATVNITSVATQTCKIRIGLLSSITGCTPSYNFTDFSYTANTNNANTIAAGLRDAINSGATDITATAAGNVVTINAVASKHPGIDGNGIQLQVVNSANITLTPSGATLTGGVSAGVWDVTINFNTVAGGFSATDPIDETTVERVLFNFVSTNYQNFPGTLSPADFWVTFTNWSVTGSGASWFTEPAALRNFPGLGVAVDYDDESDKTPEWVAYNIQALGFKGLIDVYVGAQRFYDKTEDAAQPSGWKADTSKTWNTAAEAWLKDLMARLATLGNKTVWAYSLELFDPDAAWTQRDYLNNHANTAFGYLVSPTDAAILTWYKALYLKLAQELNTAGLEKNLQYGEFWWWWRTQNNAPCFYDQDTKDQYLTDFGVPIPTYTDKATTSYSQTTAEWLRDKLGDFSIAIRDHVKGTYGTAKFGPLYFPPTVEPYPLMAVVNLPTADWNQTNADFFISETYDWVMASPTPNFADSQRAMVRPLRDTALAFSRANTWHISGFVDTSSYSGATLVQWAKVVQNTRMAYAWKRLGQVAVWSIRQVIRDSWQPDGAIYVQA